MNSKILYGLLGVLVLAVLITLVVTSRSSNTPADVATTTVSTTTESASVTSSTASVSGVSAGVATPAQEQGDVANGTYTLDVKESSIGWTGRKPKVLGYEDSGTLMLKSGSLTVTNGFVATGDFVIDMNTITPHATSNTKATLDMLQKHLSSPDFFDIAQYPEARFVLKNMINGSVTGDLTIKGVTKTISFPATLSEKGTSLIADAQVTLNRSLWNIRYGSGSFFDNLGDSLIADEVAITLHLVATR